MVYCRCCNTNAVRVEGVDTLADLDKVTSVVILDTIDEVSLRYPYDIRLTFSDRTTSSANVFGCVPNGYPTHEYPG